jgi:hypothetical protein
MARSREFYRQQAARIARGAGIDPRVFVQQIQQESGFNPNARSPAGAQGIAQIVPKYHPTANVRDPIASLKYAARLDSQLLRRYGNWRDALSVYNSGRPFKVGQRIGETRNYVASILGGVRNPQNNPHPGSVGSDTNDVFGGSTSRPQALASFLLQNSLNMAAGKPFDISGMMAAAQQDKAEAANTMHGMDPGGTDPADPRVKMEPGSGYRGPGGAKEMLDAIRQARKMGLRVGENDAVGEVHSVHVPSSYHYQDYKGTRVSRASDISGSPQQMAAFYKMARTRYGKNLTELFYDPLGGIKYGKPIGAIGGHRDHVHIAF